MPVRIYHNPRCNTSRKTLALLRDKGVEPEIVEYLKTPYTSAQLKTLLGQLKMPAKALIRKKEAAAAGIDDMPELATSDPDPQRLTADAERRRALDLSLRMLPEKERAALVLRDLEGLSTREVARVLGSSEATVRSQVSKARVKIRGFLERYFRRRI